MVKKIYYSISFNWTMIVYELMSTFYRDNLNSKTDVTKIANIDPYEENGYLSQLQSDSQL